MTYSLVGATTRRTHPLGMERRLVAILSADVQGYSRLMRTDETATIHTLKAYRSLMASLIQQYRGRVVDDPGDNLLAEFPSVVEAVQCAVIIQRILAARNAVLPRHRQMVFRMGLHIGDVVVDQERLYGEAVNLTARLEGMAEGGGLCISGTVYDHVATRLPLDYRALGVWMSEDMPTPVRVYQVQVGSLSVPPHQYARADQSRPAWWSARRMAQAVLGSLTRCVSTGARASRNHAYWETPIGGPRSDAEADGKPTGPPVRHL